MGRLNAQAELSRRERAGISRLGARRRWLGDCRVGRNTAGETCKDARRLQGHDKKKQAETHRATLRDSLCVVSTARARVYGAFCDTTPAPLGDCDWHSMSLPLGAE